MRHHQLKLNTLKCAFRVRARNFLGFLVHQRGIIRTKQKLLLQPMLHIQKFMSQVNYLRRFISNLVGKTKELSYLVKLKDMEKFRWEKQHQAAFDKIKVYLSKPHVLMSHIQCHPLKLYLLIAYESIGCLLAQKNSKGHESSV